LLILSTLKMEATCSSETLVPTRSTWCHIPEYCILHSYCHENVKSYVRSVIFTNSWLWWLTTKEKSCKYMTCFCGLFLGGGGIETVPSCTELFWKCGWWMVLFAVPACKNSTQGHDSLEEMLVQCEPWRW
jgi:hypothetical protein